MENGIGITAAFGVAVLLTGCAARSYDESHSAYLTSEYRKEFSGRYQSAKKSKPIELTKTKDPGLNTYVAYAIRNNPGLEAAFDRWKAAIERIPQVEALPDPRLTYRYYVRQVETRVGAMRQGFALSQTFPWLGKLALRGDVAARLAEAQRRQFEAKRLMLFYQVKDAYYEYYYLRRSIGIVRDNLLLVRRMEQVARTRYKAAVGSHADVIRAQVELGKLDDRLKSLRDLRQPIMARLNAALNRPAGAPLPWPEKIRQEKVSFTDDQMLAWLDEFNPTLQAMDAETAAARRRVELAKKDYFPDVTVGMNYTEISNSTGGRHPSGDGRDAVALMASINLPIWYDKLAAGVRGARHNQWAASLRRNQRANDLSARLKLVLYRFHDAQRKINLYRDTLVPKAVEAVGASESSFRAGKASFTDLIDAQRIMLAFELASERALADRAQRLAELEMLVGRQVPRAGKAAGRKEPANKAALKQGKGKPGESDAK